MTAPEPAGSVPIEALLVHRDWVRALARSICFDRNRADDVEQETWRLVLERPPRHAESLRAWFGRAVRNVAISSGRKERVRSRHEPSAAPRQQGPSPDESVAAAELQTKLARAVLELEEPYRTTVVLRYFEDLEASDIAARLGVPVETVRTRLKRAHARLRERMDVDLRDDRDAWALLVVGVRFSKVKAAATAGGVAAAVGGGLAMAAATKIVAAGVVAAAGVGWWLWSHDAASEKSAATVPTTEAQADTVKASPAKREPRVRTPAVSETSAPAASTPTAPIEIPLGPDVVHGRVLDDDTGAAVAKVKVSLVWEHARDPGEEPSAVTGADGGFRIPGAKDGRFGELLLQAEGYAECLVELPWRSQTTKLAKYDAGDVRIFRGKRILGRVLAADGRTPVAGASVRFTTSGGSSSTMWIHEAVERAVTDADGAFAVDRVPPSHAWPYTVFAVTKDGVGWTVLAGDAGRVDAKGVEVVLRPNGGAIVAARDESGAPQSRVLVVASPRFEPLGPPVAWEARHDVYVKPTDSIASIFSAKTDEHGVARFAALPTLEERSYYDFIVYGKAGLGWKDGVPIRPGETATVEVVVVAAKKRALAGLVHRFDGTPIAGAVVRCGAAPTPTTTGQDGRFRLDVERAENWERDYVVVKADGFGAVERSIKADPKQSVLEIDVALKPSAPIAGRVVDEDGKPLVGAWVRTPRDDASINGWNVQTDDAGKFAFPDATPGEWRVSVDPPPPEDEWAWQAETIVRGGDKDVVIVRTHVPPGKARVVATVVDEAGAPVAPDEAWLQPAEETPPAALRSFGEIKLGGGSAVIERVRVGRWRLHLRVPGRIGAIAWVDVAEGQTEVPIRVVVGKPGVLRGRVVLGEEGATMPTGVMPQSPDDWSIFEWARPHGPRMVGAAAVAADGTFEFPEVMPGRWRVWSQQGGFVGEGFADVPAGGEATCVVTVTRPGTVSFQLSSPPPSARVDCRIAFGGGVLRRVISKDVDPGKPLKLETSLPPGRFRWSVTFPAEKGWTSDRVAATTQEGEVVVTAGETAVVAVRVVPK